MRRLFFLFLFFIFHFSFFISAAYAAATPTKTPVEAQVNQLKDRIASRVAELKLVERRGIMGTATEVSDTQIKLSDIQNNIRFVDVDELTKFSSPSAKGSFGISDIAKGDTVGVLGLYNKQSRRMLARFVDILALPKTFHGVVTEINVEEFSLKVITNKSDTITIDVENTTKTFLYTKGSGLLRSGFSKITEGKRIFVTGFEDRKDKKRIAASRIIVFPELPPNPRINLSLQQTSPATSSVKETEKQ